MVLGFFATFAIPLGLFFAYERISFSDTPAGHSAFRDREERDIAEYGSSEEVMMLSWRRQHSTAGVWLRAFLYVVVMSALTMGVHYLRSLFR